MDNLKINLTPKELNVLGQIIEHYSDAVNILDDDGDLDYPTYTLINKVRILLGLTPLTDLQD